MRDEVQALMAIPVPKTTVELQTEEAAKSSDLVDNLKAEVEQEV